MKKGFIKATNIRKSVNHFGGALSVIENILIVTDFGEACNGFWRGLKNWEFFDILWNPNCPEKSDFLKKSDFLSPPKMPPQNPLQSENIICCNQYCKYHF